MGVNFFITLEHTFDSDGFILQFCRISMNSAQNGVVLQNKKKVITYIAALLWSLPAEIVIELGCVYTILMLGGTNAYIP